MTTLSRRDFLNMGSAQPRAPDNRVHIASLLLQVMPSAISAISAEIAAIPGAELHRTVHPGKLAVVLDAPGESHLADATQRLSQLPGVLTVSIVCHLIEDADALAEDIE